jgi:predicted DNA-binding transcriptional regulator YafY
VLSWRRRWYVAGFDRDRTEPRSFRLSRITSPVKLLGPAGAFERPPHVNLTEMVVGRRPDEGRLARVRVSGNRAGQLRRLADSEANGVLTIRMVDTEYLARIVASAGTAAQALEPPDLVDAVIARRSAVVQSDAGAA